MIKVQNKTATREPIPAFLRGLLPESLADLSWTDPALGVSDCAWWPEEDISGQLPEGSYWGNETLSVDASRKVVLVSREAVPYTPEQLAEQLDALREPLTQQNNAAYSEAIGRMTAGYPDAEIATWERQRAEVIAWAQDSAVPTPWIDLAASSRGVARGEYLSRTLVKVTAFAQASAWLTGRRQGIEDLIRAATSTAQLDAISIDYTLPEA